MNDMVGFDAKTGLYFCEVCGLHYTSKELAEKCQQWCSHHNSCNLEIARQSVEATKARERLN
ncbi:MAG: hypothetical protein ACP5GD_02975 [Candidatus Micrarchaeia archaeon]|jgi:hypothetical protein